jgi:hypothetical protein
MEPLVSRSATRIGPTEGVWSRLISIVDLETDGPSGFFYTQPVKTETGKGDSMAGGKRAQARYLGHEYDVVWSYMI